MTGALWKKIAYEMVHCCLGNCQLKNAAPTHSGKQERPVPPFSEAGKLCSHRLGCFELWGRKLQQLQGPVLFSLQGDTTAASCFDTG